MEMKLIFDGWIDFSPTITILIKIKKSWNSPREGMNGSNNNNNNEQRTEQ